MVDEKEKQPFDARLLNDAIIELNISRRNVSIYPRNHPLVEGSLNRAFEFLQKLFDLRVEVTLGIAKDTLIIDDYFLDKKNPVYKEFALTLNSMNIASVTFIKGLTKDELYSFHLFISENTSESSKEVLERILKEYNLTHVKIGFIDYSLFYLDEGKTEKGATKGHLWEQYVFGLLEGRFETEDVSTAIHEIPPEVLAGLINRVDINNLKEEAYDKVITTYLKKTSERAFSSKELKRLLDFINELRPQLKKQFLSSTVGTVSKDMDSATKAFGDMSVDKVIELLNTINEQKVAIPDTLLNLLDKLSKLKVDGIEDLTFGEEHIADDIFLSPDVMSFLSKSEFESFMSDTYQKEIQRLLEFDASKVYVEEAKEYEKEWTDELIERDFNQTILEFILSDTPDVIPQEKYEYFTNILKEQLEQFINTGQYPQILKIVSVLKSDNAQKRFPEITVEVLSYYNSPEFISLIIDSFRIMGRQMREEAMLLCEYYGERIIPALMDALAEEGSQTIRSLFLSLITHFGDKAVPEAVNRLRDSRWFVKRNMLFILSEYGGEDVLKYIRPYSRHENPQVRFQAIKHLLKIGDRYGIEVLRKHLKAESRDLSEKAIALAGLFKVRDVVPDLINMLKEKAISGADFHYKIPIVRALSQIGDPRALDTLRDIISAKTLFFKSDLERLKEEIYNTLKNYPYEEVKDLV
jgi:hypothetical protein